MSNNEFFTSNKHPSTSKQTRRAQFQDARKLIKKEAAEARQAVHDNLPVEEKIAKLDYKLGTGVGAVKERARLAKLLEAKKSS